ncbi:CBS domain-containing protein [Halanaerobiaceae bacterium Z-7014]|uniref:CBS domain-containing protein n=1 Tax=Halonatronomonas betaini TaxID=2778430 RepID=A0A931FBK1_9FIRM|nr:CBS domain-containing protein [Halonatronomonas betaini]MBF8438057.1 CBS domain-containing protein [Halonatronomonas betaini]
MKTAKDIMTEEVITIEPETSVEEAAELMSQYNVSGLPVLENGKLTGIVTEKDLIVKDKKLHFPEYINLIGGIIYLESYKKFQEEFKKYIAVKVKDLMTKQVETISPDTPVSEIADLMSKEEVNRLPVLDGDELVGIVTRGDLIKNMSKK